MSSVVCDKEQEGVHSTLPKNPQKWQSLPPGQKSFSRSSLRRSFTIPRNLLSRQSGESGPVSQSSSNFIRNIYLTFLRPPKEKEQCHNSPPKPELTPLAVGLKNQGNTCYMNSILQCLSHTDALAKFIVTDAYKRHLRRKLWAKSSKREVTEEFASILKSAWLRLSLNILEEAAAKFKTAVERGAPQWRGSEEHDAQEFLLWILDTLHEDLNQPSLSRKKVVRSGRCEEDLAAEALWEWSRSNQSVIQEIFGAQFRSSLTCPECGRESATFEPFVCVSLPIPEAKEDIPVFISLLYLSQQPRLVKLGLSLPSGGEVKDLKDALAADTQVNRMFLLEIDGEGFHRTFTDSQPLSACERNDALYALETPEPLSPTEAPACVLLVWINILVAEGTRVRFGSPYISQFARETAYDDLQKLLLKEMGTILRPGVLHDKQKAGVFSIRIVDASAEGCLVDPSLAHPLYMEAVDDALSLCDADVVPHVKLLLEWDPRTKEDLIGDESESVEEHWSLQETKDRHNASSEGTVGLNACFELYSGAEELSADNSWHCPHCNRKQRGTLKTIGLWSTPEILLLHLKRFRQGTKVRGTVSKISSLVDFPLESLDLRPHVSKRTRPKEPILTLNNNAKARNHCFGGWRQRASFKKGIPLSQIRNHGLLEEENFLYDLFAVCNHHGKDLQGGHYTAYCKNPVERKWWAFDDTRVRELLSTDEIKSSAAYILFYRKKAKAEQEGIWLQNLRKQKTKNHNQSETKDF